MQSLDWRGFWGPMLALAIICLIGWLFKAHCLQNGGWADGIQYVTGCYSDAVPFWNLRGVSAGELPYFQARMEYPVLTGALIWVEGTITRTLFGAGANAGDFLGVVSLVNALFAGLILWMFWRSGVERTRLWGWAAAPPLILYLGHNWDLLAATLAVAAVLMAHRGRTVSAAALAGLGVAAKLFPIVLLPILGIAALAPPARGGAMPRIRHAALLVFASVGAWATVNVAPAVLAFDNWWEFYRFSSERSGTAASLWELAAQFDLYRTSNAARNAQALILFVAGAAIILIIGWNRHGHRAWVLMTPVLAWFLLTNKVYSPQFDLWIYPLMLLTSRRLWPIALFALTDIGAYFAEFWYFAGQEGHTPSTTHVAIACWAGARAIVLIGIIGSAVGERAPAWLEPGPTDAAEPTPAAVGSG